jgi:hypothetical protein
MKSIIALILLISTVSYAKPKLDSNGCYQKTITICPLHKPNKPVPKPIVVPAPLVQIEYKTVEVKVPVPVTVYRDRTKLVPVPYCPGCPPEGNMVVGLRLGLGLSAMDPYTSGLVGVRLRWPKAWLGLDAYSNLQYGFGFQLLFYPYQGRRVNLHFLDLGVRVSPAPFRNYGEADIRRNIDLLFGAGAEIRVGCYTYLGIDLVSHIPDPALLSDKSTCRAGSCSRVDVSHVIGNALANTQLFLSVIFHNVK